MKLLLSGLYHNRSGKEYKLFFLITNQNMDLIRQSARVSGRIAKNKGGTRLIDGSDNANPHVYHTPNNDIC